MSHTTVLTGRAAALLGALWLGALPAAAQEPDSTQAPDSTLAPGIHVTQGVVGIAVEDREPVGVAESFSADVGHLYFYTLLEGDFRETRLEHVWLHEGEERARVSLRAMGPRWRTWSRKAIDPEWRGQWEVQVVAPDGEVLASRSFSVGG